MTRSISIGGALGVSFAMCFSQLCYLTFYSSFMLRQVIAVVRRSRPMYAVRNLSVFSDIRQCLPLVVSS